MMGVTVEQAAAGLAEAGAGIVGSNCGRGIEDMVGVAGEYKRHTELPLVIQANAGLPEFQAEYPLAGIAGRSLRLFLLWELCYLTYYVAWEFFFRGFWQIGLLRHLGVIGVHDRQG